MRAKSIALLMLALGCGLVAAIGITQVMAKRNTGPASGGETQSIFIADKDIPLGEHLTAEVLKLEPWPKDKIPQGTISKIEDLDGRRTRAKLYAGEPILENKLFGKGMGQQGDSSLIQKGYRVVSVKVDNVSGGLGLIVPGDRVDVLVHLQRNPSQDIQETSTRTILQNIKVFAVNDVVDLEREKDSKDKEKISAKTISLLVTPSQAAKLTLATEMGKVRLIMRPLDEDTNSNDGTAKPGELFGQSQRGTPEKETLSEPPPKPQDKKSGMADFLNNMQKQLTVNAKSVVPGISSETWTMRILQPNGINEVVLEAENTPAAAKQPFGSWRMSGTTTTSAVGNSNNIGNNNKKPVPPLSAPLPNVPPPPEVVPPPSNPEGSTNANPTTNPKPTGKAIIRDPFADPADSPLDEPNLTTPEKIN